MGHHNVKKVFAFWVHLEHRETRALTYMANESRDGDTPPIYFGGWEALAHALGANVQGNPESARKTAMRALGMLGKAGAIVSSGQARSGVRANYAIALDPAYTFLPTGKGRDVKWKQIPREGGTATGTLRGTASDPLSGTATGMQGGTATGQVGGQLQTPLLNNQSKPNKEMDREHHLGDQLTWEESTTPDDDESNLSEEQERNRQTAALLKLIAQEDKDTDAA